MGSRGLTASACQARVAGGMAERAEHRTPEAAAVGVVAVEREPRDRAGRAAGRDPRAQQRALARTGRGGQQRQRTLHAGVEGVEQPAARHHRRSARAAR